MHASRSTDKCGERGTSSSWPSPPQKHAPGSLLAMHATHRHGIGGRARIACRPTHLLRATRPRTIAQKPSQTATSKTEKQAPAEKSDDQKREPSLSSLFYVFLTGYPFPLGPAFIRETIRREVERDTIWVFEQTQGLENFSVFTPVRMTVIKLRSGGLWVHAPIAPTGQCVRLVKELGAPVEYIVLPTFAYEHKAFVGPFSREFPKAKVYVTPYQWSFPLNLPSQFFGIFPTGELSSTEEGMPWAEDIEQELLLPPSIGIGDYARQGECAFFHKRSRTLLLTDAVMYLDDNVPDIIPKDALLESARDSWLNRFRAGNRTAAEVKAIARPEPAADTPQNRLRGWRRMSLLVLYFNPSNLLEPDASFEALSDRLIVPPVVETLVYSKFRGAVRRWVDSIVSRWSFSRVIPCHFAAPVRATPADFKRAFAFAYEDTVPASDDGEAAPEPAASGPAGLLASLIAGIQRVGGQGSSKVPRAVVFPEADIKTLRDINNILLRSGVVREIP